VQFQEYFKNAFEKEAHKRRLTMNIQGVKPNVDKDLRIVTLQPWIKNGWILFKRYGMGELIRHLIYYRPKGKGGHDDGPDALEMLKSLLEGATKTGLIEFQSTGTRRVSSGGSMNAFMGRA